MRQNALVRPHLVHRAIHRVWCRLLGYRVELVYHDEYSLACPYVPIDPLRAERILASLASAGLVRRCDVHEPKPVALKTLERVHEAGYLDSVTEPETLSTIVGDEVTPDQGERLVDWERWQTGGTVLATRLARQCGVAANLGGGFHHARKAAGAGFCIFNDVAVAVAEARRQGFAGRVLIVDLDLHDGDGTRELFADDAEVHTFSIHARHWGPVDVPAATSIELGNRVDDAAYLAAIRNLLPAVFAEFRPQLVFYVAGCDPAREDELGDWKISVEGMLARDRLVTDLARGGGRKVPLVIVLGGGYGQEAWRYSTRYLSALMCRRGAIEPPTTEEITFKRYRYIAGLFEAGELSGASGDNEFGLTAEDLYLPAWGASKETRLLGFYTRHGIELVLERAGLLDRLRDLGFTHPTLDFDLNDPGGDTLRIYTDPARTDVLVELRVQRDRRSLPGAELLSIEWLCLQNPRATFSPPRQQLPGQKYPGLGMLKDVVAMLTIACDRLHLDGLVFVPSQYHIAAQWRGYLFFLDPEARARFAALQELLADLPLAAATKAMAEGRVVEAATGEVVRWQPEPMIAPLSERLKRQTAAGDHLGKTDRQFRFRLLDPAPGP